MKNVFSLLFLFLTFLGCQPKSIVGLYSTAQPGRMTFVNQQIQLNEDGTFNYNYASDDLSSNQKGKGNYQYADRKLILKFAALETRQSSITKNKAGSRFSNVLKLYVQDLENQPLIGVELTLRDLENKVLIRGISNEKGNCILPWKAGQIPGSIEVSYFGFSNLIAPLDQESALDYTINMSHIYRPIPGGTVWEYTAKKIVKEKMILIKDNRTSTFVKVKP